MSARADVFCLLATLLLVARRVAHIVFSFFYLGGGVGDLTFFSTLSWHNQWDLRLPPLFGYPDTGFEGHFFLFFWLPSAISWLLPLGRIAFFGWFCGILCAGLGLSLWLLLRELWPARQAWAVIVKCAAAATFALNANCQSTLSGGHLEFAGPAFILIFLWGLLRKNQPVTLIVFVLALSLREDMGFHIFGLLFLVLVTDRWRRVPWDQSRPVLIYACAALGYSLVVLALQYLLFNNIAFSGNTSIFRLIYAGPGFFHHVSLDLLRDRLINLALHRYWIWAPGVIALPCSLIYRNPYILIGWLAFVPWLMLSLMAYSPFAGNLGFHYGYPFMIAGAWPVLAMGRRFTEPRQLPPVPLTPALAWVFLLLAVQQPVEIHPAVRFSSWLVPQSAVLNISPAAYDELERRLPRALTEIGQVRVDQGLFSIAPYALGRQPHRIRKKEWNALGWSPAADEVPTEQGVDAVMYFRDGYDARYVTDLIRVNRLHNHYRLPGTPIYLSTSENLDKIPALRDLFAPADPPPPEARKAGR